MSDIGVLNRETDALLGTEVPTVDAAIDSRGALEDLRARWAESRAVPVFVEDRTAGADQSFGGLDIRTLVRGEQSAGRFAVHSLVLAPGAALPSHYLDDTHSYLLVTEGLVELGIGVSTDVVGQHSLGYAPPMTHLSARNDSDAPATVMLIHHPAGSDRAFRAAHEQAVSADERAVADYADVLVPFGFHFEARELDNDARTNQALPAVDFELKGAGDMERLREMFASRPGIPRLVRTTPDEYDAAAVGETRRKELLNGDVSAGTAMFNMLSGVPGMNAPAHHQPTEEEFFFVTGGRLTVTCATKTKPVEGGAFAFAPRNCTHGFANQTESEARFVTLNSPAGHERSLAVMRRLAAENASKEQLVEASIAGGWVMHDPEELTAPRR